MTDLDDRPIAFRVLPRMTPEQIMAMHYKNVEKTLLQELRGLSSEDNQKELLRKVVSLCKTLLQQGIPVKKTATRHGSGKK